MKLEQVTGAIEVVTAAGTEQAVGSDLSESPGEDVLQESSDEGVDGECQVSGLASARVGVAEGDAAVLEAFEPVVGESDAVDVTGEIACCVSAAADLLDVDVPALCPGIGRDVPIQAGAGHGVVDLGSEDFRQNIPWHKEPRVSGLDPGGAIG